MNPNTITNRHDLQKAIADIHVFRRFLICLFNRKEHKIALAYSIVTVDLLYKNHPMMDEMWKKSDELWAKLYGIDYQPEA